MPTSTRGASGTIDNPPATTGSQLRAPPRRSPGLGRSASQSFAVGWRGKNSGGVHGIPPSAQREREGSKNQPPIRRGSHNRRKTICAVMGRRQRACNRKHRRVGGTSCASMGRGSGERSRGVFSSRLQMSVMDAAARPKAYGPGRDEVFTRIFCFPRFVRQMRGVDLEGRLGCRHARPPIVRNHAPLPPEIGQPRLPRRPSGRFSPSSA